MVNFVYLALGLLMSSNAFSYTHCVNPLTFAPRSITHDATYELALSNYDFYHPRCTNKIVNIYLTPLYQQSFHAGNVIPQLLNERYCSYFKSNEVDIKRSVYGMHIALFANLSRYCDNAWAAVEFAPIGTTIETCLEDSGLLNLPSGFGQIKSAGVDDIQLKLGWNHFSFDEEEHIGGYLVISVPTSRDHSIDALPSQIGTHNPAVGGGINGDAVIVAGPEYALHFMADAKYRYLLNGKDCRMLNVHGQPSILGDYAAEVVREVKLTPRGQLELWSALHWAYFNMHLEMGWNLWVRQAEKVTINPELAASDSLVLNALASPAAMSNKVYAAIAYDTFLYSMPMFVGLGTSVEVGHKTTANDSWSVWGKLGFEY